MRIFQILKHSYNTQGSQIRLVAAILVKSHSEKAKKLSHQKLRFWETISSKSDLDFFSILFQKHFHVFLCVLLMRIQSDYYTICKKILMKPFHLSSICCGGLQNYPSAKSRIHLPSFYYFCFQRGHICYAAWNLSVETKKISSIWSIYCNLWKLSKNIRRTNNISSLKLFDMKASEGNEDFFSKIFLYLPFLIFLILEKSNSRVSSEKTNPGWMEIFI